MEIYSYGYNILEFEIQDAIDNRLNSGGKLLKKRDPDNSSRDLQVHSYQHDEAACYYCLVSAKDATIEELDKLYINNLYDSKYKEKKKAYYRALAREKNNLVKVSDYINSSKIQY